MLLETAIIEHCLPATIKVVKISSEGSEVWIEWLFKSGNSYCCYEPGCHLPYYKRSWWQDLRQQLDTQPPLLRIHCKIILEPGSQFMIGGRLHTVEDQLEIDNTWTEPSN